MPTDLTRIPGYRGTINNQPGVWSEKEWQMHVGIQRQFLKTPNESVWDLCELRFGRGQYEDLFAGKWKKTHPHLYEETVTGHSRVKRGWQKLLDPPDPFALCHLHNDPTWEWSLEDGGVFRKAYELWNPMRLMNSCVTSVPICDAILGILGDTGMPDTKPLSRAINAHFRTIYIPSEEALWKEKRAEEDNWKKYYSSEVTWDRHKLKVYRFLEDTLHLLSGCLLHHFQVHNELWHPVLFQSSALEERFTEAKLMIEHVKAGGFTFDFA